jgi:hypothetical protein
VRWRNDRLFYTGADPQGLDLGMAVIASQIGKLLIAQTAARLRARGCGSLARLIQFNPRYPRYPQAPSPI